MCYPALEFVSDKGVEPVTKFITENLDKDTRNWVIAGIQELEQRKGNIHNGDLETKHIKDKIFELKFKKI